MAVAQENDAPDEVLGSLQALPPGRIFASMQEVWDTVSGGHIETHRH